MKNTMPVVTIAFLLTVVFAASALAGDSARPPSIVGTWTGNGSFMDQKTATVTTIPVVFVVNYQKSGLIQGAVEENPPDSFLSFSVTGTFANPNIAFSGIDADGVTAFGYGQLVGKKIKLQLYDFKNGTTSVTLKKKGS